MALAAMRWLLPNYELCIDSPRRRRFGWFFLTAVGPLFWDQYDNAQRVDETGFGVRLRSYAWTED
jgi:hypothetical protein